MIIDFHSHFIPQSLIRSALDGTEIDGVRMARTAEGGLYGLSEGREFDLPDWTADLEDLPARLRRLDSLGLDKQVLSVAPRLYRYDADPAFAVPFSRRMNDDLAEWTASDGGRFMGLIHLPLQDPAACVAELERMSDKPGIIGAGVGTNIAGRPWDEPDLLPVLRKADELGMFVFFHPVNRPADPRMRRWHLKNLVGNPLETTLAIAALIFGGVLDRLSAPKLGFAHAGGYAVFGAGRFDAGYLAREDVRAGGGQLPSDYLRQLYFDCITFSDLGLRHLVDAVGIERVILGSDYPADMGTLDPVGFVRDCTTLTEAEKKAILGENVQLLTSRR